MCLTKHHVVIKIHGITCLFFHLFLGLREYLRAIPDNSAGTHVGFLRFRSMYIQWLSKNLPRCGNMPYGRWFGERSLRLLLRLCETAQRVQTVEIEMVFLSGRSKTIFRKFKLSLKLGFIKNRVDQGHNLTLTSKNHLFHAQHLFISLIHHDFHCLFFHCDAYHPCDSMKGLHCVDNMCEGK